MEAITIETLGDAKQTLRELGHRLTLINLASGDQPALHYGLCSLCNKAAEYCPSIAERHGWPRLYGPAARGPCEA